MTMKTSTSSKAQNTFGHVSDTAQRKSVVTERNRSVGAMSEHGQGYETISNQAEREMVRKGVMQGIAEANAGKGRELNDELVTSIKQELQSRIDAKQNA